MLGFVRVDTNKLSGQQKGFLSCLKLKNYKKHLEEVGGGGGRKGRGGLKGSFPLGPSTRHRSETQVSGSYMYALSIAC